MSDLVSVIVPVYNVTDFLDRSIQSIINQTYTNIEIILVDDGSTDDSGYKCDEYAKNDSRIYVIHKSNGGQGSARNKGLDICKGDYVIFLDSDDYMDSECIQVLLKLLIEHECDVAACNYRFVTECGEDKGNFTEESFLMLNGYDVIQHMWNDEIINIAPWAKLYKRKLWRNFRFQECYCEDSATMYKLYDSNTKVCFSGRPLVNYVMRSSSDVRCFTDKKLYMLDLYNDVVAYAENNFPDFLIKAAYSKFISVNFHVMAQLPKGEYETIRKRICGNIKKYRWLVLTNSKSRKKTRIACLLSYIGINNTCRLLNVIKSNNPTF